LNANSGGAQKAVSNEVVRMKEKDAINEAEWFAAAAQPDKKMADILASHPFAKDLDRHQRRLLADCAMEKTFEAGEVIFREGDPANRFYLILDGKVVLESYVQDRGRVAIQTIGAGDVVGWSWLFPPYYWQFDARAAEPTKAIFFYATPLREEAENDHELGYELYKRFAEIMLKRLQATRRRLLESCTCKAC
jgi:CRP/FNR family transcriptional regulator, cyclic AMP receptor protein